MTAQKYRYQSEFAEILRDEGREEGRNEGREEGRAEGEAKLVLRALERRGIEVPDSARERITTCGDTEVLERWFDRAITATLIEQLFD